MEELLNNVELRVLGSIVEKSITTPDYYPMTLNSITTACNQKSNRSPVVAFDDKTVVRALDDLRDRKLICMISTAGSRVPKYQHSFQEVYSLNDAETAVLCLLALRGPQTCGELKGRSGRLYDFETISEVENTLNRLINREELPLAVKLPVQPGKKECRYTHLFCGMPEIEETEPAVLMEGSRLTVQAENERITQLEEKVQELETKLAELTSEFTTFRQLLE